jgi:nitroreductase
MFRDLVLRNRTVRRFYQDQVDRETLVELVDMARNSASGSNRQPLKYILSCEPEKNTAIFQNINLVRPSRELRPADEQPAAYIIILGDKEIAEVFTADHGIAAQSIMLGAREKGLAGCIVGLIHREELAEALQIPARYQVLLVLALGKPKEEVRLEKVGQDGKTAFWWDEQGVFHMPKRSLDDVIIASYAPEKVKV